MGRATFESYGARAGAALSHTEIAGRYDLQHAAERRIVADVAGKLALNPDDSLLEIGCGTGNLLIPLSLLVARAMGIDHAGMIAGLAVRQPDSSIETLAGNFLDLELEARFSKLLVYSVLHCLADAAEVGAFVDKAARLLRPGGRLLLGDLPNAQKKARFIASPAGRAFAQAWQAKLDAAPRRPDALHGDPELVRITDHLVLDLLGRARTQGMESYLLAQPPDLPFGHTREDILIIAPNA